MHHNGQSTTSYYGSDRSYGRSEKTNPVAPKQVSAAVACGLLLPIDFMTLSGSGLAAYSLRLLDDPYADWLSYGLVIAFGVLLAVNIFQLCGLYDSKIVQRKRQTYQRLVVGWFAVASSMTMISFLAKTSDDYSRAWALMWFASGLLVLLVTRILFYAQISRWIADGKLQNKIAILGDGRLGIDLSRFLSQHAGAGIRVSGIFSASLKNIGSPQTDSSAGFKNSGHPTLNELVNRIRRDHIDTVVIAMPKLNRRRLGFILEYLRDVPVDIRICPNPTVLDLRTRGISHIAGLPLINAVNRPLSNWRLATKEIEDRILALSILCLISPLLVAIAILIKLDSPGPVLFRQKRYGYNNQLITVFKFRTMRINQQDNWASQLTQRNDPRVTRIGAFLRKTSLDELPQFFNVLRGEMSIVGPRPHAIQAKAGGVLYHEAVSHYAARHRVKPGITGWAQINGWRGSTDTVLQIEKRVEHDLYYIENWSLWLDLKIIALTLFKGFGGANAY